MLDDLTPASREELKQGLSYALRFDDRGKAHRLASDFMTDAAAELLVRYLESAGFVVMKKPPAQHHSTGQLTRKSPQ